MSKGKNQPRKNEQQKFHGQNVKISIQDEHSKLKCESKRNEKSSGQNEDGLISESISKKTVSYYGTTASSSCRSEQTGAKANEDDLGVVDCSPVQSFYDSFSFLPEAAETTNNKATEDYEAQTETSYECHSSIQKLQAQIADAQKTYMGSLNHTTVQNALHKLEDRTKDAQVGYRSILQKAFNNLEDHVLEVQAKNRVKCRRINIHCSSPATLPVNFSASPSSAMVRTDRIMCDNRDDLCSSLQVLKIQKSRPMTATINLKMTLSARPVCERPKTSQGTRHTCLQQKQVSLPAKESTYHEPMWCSGLSKRQQSFSQAAEANERTSTPKDSLFITKDAARLPTPETADVNVTGNSSSENLREVFQPTTLASTNSSSVSSTNINLDIIKRNKEHISNSVPDSEKVSSPVAYLSICPSFLRDESSDFSGASDSQHDITSFDTEEPEKKYPYPFKCPVPYPFDTADLRQFAKENGDWRQINVNSTYMKPVVSAMIDRLVEMERLQMETRDNEERKTRVLRKFPVARFSKARDKRCEFCLQSTCSWDCPNKRVESNGQNRRAESANKRVDANGLNKRAVSYSQTQQVDTYCLTKIADYTFQKQVDTRIQNKQVETAIQNKQVSAKVPNKQAEASLQNQQDEKNPQTTYVDAKIKNKHVDAVSSQHKKVDVSIRNQESATSIQFKQVKVNLKNKQIENNFQHNQLEVSSQRKLSETNLQNSEADVILKNKQVQNDNPKKQVDASLLKKPYTDNSGSLSLRANSPKGTRRERSVLQSDNGAKLISQTQSTVVQVCKICQKRHIGKCIRVFQALPERPKTAVYTMPRGRSIPKYKDLRNSSAFIQNEYLNKNIERLDPPRLQPTPPTTPKQENSSTNNDFVTVKTLSILSHKSLPEKPSRKESQDIVSSASVILQRQSTGI